nr:hypothetical protein [Tanacetum cinerariifolium]
TLLPQIRAKIREEFRTSSGPSDAGGNPPPVTIHTWLERFNKQKPHSFEKATAPVDAENWISHMENICDVMGCEDAFKTRLAVYKFEGNALAWWKAYKQAKGGDAWLITVTWADFKKLFFLQFFPRAEQERLKREYHSIRQTNNETSTEFMQRFLRLAGFLGAAADRRGGSDNHRSSNNNYSGSNNRSSGNGRDQRNGGSAVQPICQFCPEVPLRATPIQFALLVDADTQESVIELLADKKPGASVHVFAITEDQANKTSGTITGTLFIYGHAVFVLFDTGATHSVISSAFASRVTTTPTLLDHVLCISTPMQDSVRITHVYRNLPLQFDDKIRVINVLPLDMCEFDIILGMDWLTKHHATIDCRSYRVIFGDIHAPEFIYHGSLPGKSMQIISALQASNLLSHGCEDVFPDELPGIPPVREVEFNIELILGSEPISKAPYCMAPIELKELKDHFTAPPLLYHGREGLLATIHDMTSGIPTIHGQPNGSEFPDVFPDELPGIPPVREVEFNIEL